MTTPTATRAEIAVFDQIGRHKNPPSIDVTGMSLDAAAEAIYQHARRYLLSPFYQVLLLPPEDRVEGEPDGLTNNHIDGLAGYRISIEAGRFGRGRIEHQEVTQ